MVVGRTARSMVVAAIVGAGLGAVGIGAGAVRADVPIGTYLTPFREDGATFDPSTGAFAGGHYLGQSTDANGCVSDGSSISPAGNPDAYRCLPAGATMVQLADGRVLYWNALEGTENLSADTRDKDGLPVSAVPDGGRITVNDESRLLSDPTVAPAWSVPTPRDGGAHHTSTDEDLPLPAPLAATHYAYNNGSLFCADQVLLANGDVLTSGGTDYYSEPSFPGTDKGFIELEGIREVRIFDVAKNAWVQAKPMNHGRWYPSLVTLPDGRIFVASGVTKLIKPMYPSHVADSGTNVRQTEVYDPGDNTWTDTGTAGERSLPLFPRLHLLPDGHVYYDAAGQDYNPQGQAYDEATWNVAGSWDPSTRAWTDLGIPGVGTPFPGFRGSTFSAALELRPATATVTTYPAASFLTAGGVLLPTPGSYVPVADSRISTVTTDDKGAETLSTVGTGDLARRRWYSTAVPLPDGTVFAVSGADVDEVVTPGYESPIRADELFVPSIDSQGRYSGGTWRDVGEQARSRTYHNNAVLLPDGSVLIGGHAPIPSGYHQTQDGPDLPGRPGTNNHHDPSFQIWRPPYFDAARPVVQGVSSAPAGRLVIQTPDAAHITGVVLVRNTAQTHLVDGDNRTVKLPVLARSSGTVTVAVPTSTNVVPNGPYLLFAIGGAGGDPARDIPGQVVPSIGRQVFVEGTDVPHVIPASSHGNQTLAAVAPTRAVAGPERTRGGREAPVAATPAAATIPATELRAEPVRSSRRVPTTPVSAGVAAVLLLAVTATRRELLARRRR